MKNKIVSMDGSKVKNGEPDLEVVRLLELLLERAQSGNVIGCCVAVAHPNGIVDSFEAGNYNDVTMAGVLEVCKFAVIGRYVGLMRRE